MTGHDIDKLIIEVSHGDIGALEILYRELSKPVFLFALQLSKNPQIAEDAMQDTFVSIMRTSRSFTAQGNGRAWILSIAKNRVFDILRRERDYLTLNELEDDEMFSYQFSTDAEAEESLTRILRPLNPKERDIVIKRVLIGMTLTQIAEDLSLPKGSVFWSYNNAMKKLKKSLKSANERT